MWAILIDKGYQGAQDDLRVLLPKKKRPNRLLSVDDEQDSSELSSDRVIVENYFGRSSMLWEVVSLKYRWSEGMYDTTFQMCMGLTNIHISWHPLRDSDGHHYQQIRNKWFTLGEQLVKRRKLTQARYRAKRKHRIDRDLGRTFGMSETETDEDAPTQSP